MAIYLISKMSNLCFRIINYRTEILLCTIWIKLWFFIDTFLTYLLPECFLVLLLDFLPFLVLVLAFLYTPLKIMMRYLSRDRFRVVISKLNSKEYIDGVLKSKVNFEFLINLYISENDRIHKFFMDEYHQKMIETQLINLKIIWNG